MWRHMLLALDSFGALVMLLSSVLLSAGDVLDKLLKFWIFDVLVMFWINCWSSKFLKLLVMLLSSPVCYSVQCVTQCWCVTPFSSCEDILLKFWIFVIWWWRGRDKLLLWIVLCFCCVGDEEEEDVVLVIAGEEEEKGTCDF
jgi:hypothetical protein